VGNDGPELLEAQRSQMVGQCGAQRESAAGIDSIPLEAQSDGVEQMKVGRFDIGELQVSHDSSRFHWEESRPAPTLFAR
jgi:hypothetical protein